MESGLRFVDDLGVRVSEVSKWRVVSACAPNQSLVV